MVEPIAIVSLAIKGADVVTQIVRFAIEVKHFKKTCEKLKNDAVLIQDMMARAGGAKISAQDAGRIQNSLQTCLTFVTLCCQDWGILRSSFEVAFRRKHETVEKELLWCTELLIADTVVRAPESGAGNLISFLDADLLSIIRPSFWLVRAKNTRS